ncbi:MAG: hypothetical protein ABIQ58_05115 [Candidatus Limnocylindrales bacterium]
MIRSELEVLLGKVQDIGERFVPIESIAMNGDDMRVLDLQDPVVRAAVVAFEGGKVSALYDSDQARPYS